MPVRKRSDPPPVGGGTPGADQAAVGEAVLALALSRNVASGRVSHLRALGPRTRVAVYARFSSDGQTEHSIERQERLCARYLRLIGLKRYTLFADRAKSGRSLVGRTELVRLLKACDRGEYDLVVVEDYDRWSREIYDAVSMAARMERADVQFHSAAAERRYTKEDIVGAAMRAESDRIRRRNLTSAGRLQLVERGGVPNGKLYGYRDGGVPGFLVVDDAQASVVRKIFDLSEKGMSQLAIARILTEEGVPNPSGRRRWAAGTVGSILSRVIYTGLVTYGRTESVYDRETNATVIRPRPADEVPATQVEAYRIVEDAQFLRVARVRGSGKARGRRHAVQFLTERVYCDCPGAGKTPFGPQRCRLVCSTNTQFGDCKADLASLGRVEVEAEILDVLSERLGPEGRARFVDALRRSVAGDAAERAGERVRVEREIAEVDGQLDDLLSRELSRKWEPERIERRREDLQASLATLRRRLSALRVPDVDVEEAVRRLADLDAALRRVRDRLPFKPLDQADADFVHALRRIVRRVDVHKSSATPGRVRIAIHLDYAATMFGEDGEGHAEVVVRDVRFARSKRLFAAQRAETVELLRSGGASLTDAQWSAVEPAIPDIADRDAAGDPTMRPVVDALMAHLRTGYTLASLKPILARPIADGVRRLVRAGGDVALLDALRRHDPSLVGDLDLDALASYRQGLGAPMPGPDGHTPYTRVRALDGSTAPTDAQWAVAAPLVVPRARSAPPARAGDPPEPAPRVVAEAILLKLRAGIPWRLMPTRFGPWRRVFAAARRFVYAGSWDGVLAAWRRRCPELLEGLDTSPLAAHPRRRPGRGGVPAEGRRAPRKATAKPYRAPAGSPRDTDPAPDRGTRAAGGAARPPVRARGPATTRARGAGAVRRPRGTGRGARGTPTDAS